MRELRCKKEMVENGGVPTRIRNGSFHSGFIGIIKKHAYMHPQTLFQYKIMKNVDSLHSHRET